MCGMLGREKWARVAGEKGYDDLRLQAHPHYGKACSQALVLAKQVRVVGGPHAPLHGTWRAHAPQPSGATSVHVRYAWVCVCGTARSAVLKRIGITRCRRIDVHALQAREAELRVLPQARSCARCCV